MVSAAFTFLLVMDPLGNVPLFLSALRRTDPKRVQWVILRECLIALAIMVVFLFAGSSLLHLMGVDDSALKAAGGIILLLIAIRMVFPTPDANRMELTHDEPFIVPLAVPYVAGPSLLAVIVVLVSAQPAEWPWFLGGMVIAWVITTVVLYFSGFLRKVLGRRALDAVERLMGMILVILAVQMTFEGVKEFFL
ncbi:MarC family protein [Tessaracoccus terricola]